MLANMEAQDTAFLAESFTRQMNSIYRICKSNAAEEQTSSREGMLVMALRGGLMRAGSENARSVR